MAFASLEQRLCAQNLEHFHDVESSVPLVIDEAVTGEVETIPNRDLMPPPQLARDAPRLDVFKPVEIDLLVLLGQDLGGAVAHRLQCGADDLGGIHEPLVGQHRLDDDLRAVAIGGHDLLGLDKRGGGVGVFARHKLLAKARIAKRRHHRQTFGGDLIDNGFACLEATLAAQVIGDEVDGVGFRLGQFALALGDAQGDGGGFGVGRAVIPHRALGVHQAVHRDVAALGDGVVVEVVRASDLHRARAEVGVGILIGDDRDQAAVFFRADRDFAELADDGSIVSGRVVAMEM